MKQKLIDTGICELLFVELQEGSMELYITSDNWLEYKNSKGVLRHHQLYGNWQLLSRADEVTEDIAKEVVATHDYYEPTDPFSPMHVYKGYVDNVYKWHPFESYNSLLQANEIYFENPIANKKPLIDDYRDEEGGNMELFQFNLRAWKEAQQNVWDKSRTYIFKKS